MSGAVLLRGGRVVCPNTGRDEIADVRVEGASIVAVGVGLPDDGADVLDCAGKIVAPALVDLNARLNDPGLTWREDLQSGGLAAAAGGFTAVLASPETRPVMHDAALVREVAARAAREAPIQILIAGALSVDLEGEELAEIGLMIEAGAAAISDGGRPIRDTIALRHALLYARPFGAPVLLRAGDPALESGGVMHEGEVSTRIGLRGISAASEELALARIVALVRDTGCPVHVTGITSALGVQGVARARAEGLPITASTPAHNLLLTDEIVDALVYDSSARLLPPPRAEGDRQALLDGLRSGALAAAYSDHAPLTRVDKDLEFGLATPGMVGLETALSCALEGLGDPAAAIRALSTGPAAVLGLRREICEGAPAEIVVFDPDARWIVDAGALRSKCANTPLAGRSLLGVVERTLHRGRAVS